MIILASLGETMWYVMFISAILLLCFCLVLFILHFVDKKNDSDKSDEKNSGKSSDKKS
ncbi:MAG: hypothetical protein MJ227_04125 [Bacilli bacterium]|nr:hypothetical protein [Bacilli bacterium]